MSDHHHQTQRPNGLFVPPRTAAQYSRAAQYPSSTPTPSKHRLKPSKTQSFSFLFLLLFSLRSIYSLSPLLKSSSVSLFPLTFLISLLSFLLTLALSLVTPIPSKHPFSHSLHDPHLSIVSITPSQKRLLLSKSLLISLSFLLQFQALTFCPPAPTILAQLSGNLSARFLTSPNQNRSSKIRGFAFLFFGLVLLCINWDRIQCFSNFFGTDCLRVSPMLLPFLSGLLGSYEQISITNTAILQLGPKRVRLISLFFASFVLFVPAFFSVFVFGTEGDDLSFRNLGWPIVNAVVFGVLLCENHGDGDKLAGSKDFQREFLITLLCTVILELFYFPELSLWGLLLCGLFLSVAASELDPGFLNCPWDSLGSLILKPIRHILSERKSRKIAVFLLINTGYMVVEFSVGFMSNSLGLISDACHMLFDCGALAIGLYASYISRLPPNNRFYYGRGRFEILSGYVNAVLLILVGALIVLESLERILDPQEISTNSLLTVSIGGLVVNIVGLVFFHDEHHHPHGGTCSRHQHEHVRHACDNHEHRHDDHRDNLSRIHVHSPISERLHGHVDHNMEGIFLHVLADTLGSVGVVISTLLIKYKGWLISDPACSMFISVLIISSVIPLLRNSAEILLQRVPRAHERNLERTMIDVKKIKGVCGVQSLHVWSFTNTDVVGTLHLYVWSETDINPTKARASRLLFDAGIMDLTLQLECVNHSL